MDTDLHQRGAAGSGVGKIVARQVAVIRLQWLLCFLHTWIFLLPSQQALNNCSHNCLHSKACLS